MADRDELERCLERLDATERACRQVDAQLSSLGEKRAMLEQDRQRHEAEANAIRFRLQKRPCGGLSGCPDDVLLCIFEQLCISFEACWDTKGSNTYDAVRVTGPFYLAAVCTRWRRVAIGFSRLWTYVAFPPPDDHARSHTSLVRLALERSKSSPIDVLVRSHWENYHDEPEQFARSSRYWRENVGSFLTAVGPHAHRWGRAEVWCLEHRDLRLFRTPTPLLTYLKIQSEEDIDENPLTHDFLPFAPLLCHLIVEADVRCSDAHPGFPALVSLVILGEDPSWEQIRQLLTLGGESLETVTITIGSGPTDFLDTPPVSLPKLRSLVLTPSSSPPIGDPWSWNVTTPNLTTLCLDGDLDYDDLAPFLQQFSPTVTSLMLCGEFFSSDELFVIRRLCNVSELTFGTSIIASDDVYHVYDDFFADIADWKPPIWPRLTRVELGPHGNLVSPCGEGLLRLIASRSHFNSALPSDVEILRDVVVRDANSSPGVKAAIARLMSV